MQGIGSTFSRLPRVAAWIAGAAFLAGAMTQGAQAQTDEVAMAVPRLDPTGADGVALPRPLAAPDAAVLRRLFADPSQAAGAFAATMGQVDVTSRVAAEMLGHVLAARYLAPLARPNSAALAAWLATYPTLPDAPAVGALLHPSAGPTGTPEPAAPPPPPAAAPGRPALEARLRDLIRADRLAAARQMIDTARRLDAATAARLRAELAQALFTRNQDQAALDLAMRAARQARGTLGLADYIAGLALWRMDRPEEALPHFTAVTRASIATEEMRAAAGYWAARACIAQGADAPARSWLAYAGTASHSFYGQIARRLTAWRSAGPAGFVLGEADVEAVAAEPAGLRAFALLQVGQPARAEAELRGLARSQAAHPAMLRAIMQVAARAKLDGLAGDLAIALLRPGAAQAAGIPPAMPRLHPSHGFLVDPALVYGLARIESNFDPHAVSAMGAQGLMQLMPATAGVVKVRGTRPKLHDAATNLDLGQRYVAYLAQDDVVSGDLIGLLASYNSGPAAYARWSADIRANDDPLLFIEAMPNQETRNFVQHTLAYTWIYAARLHLPTPSLDDLAASQFPRFSALVH